MLIMKKALLSLLLLAPFGASAGVILAPVSFSVSSPDPSNSTLATNNILDQSGLSANYISGVTDFDTFVATTTANFTGQGELGGAGPPASFFEFDFGSSVNVDGIAIWNQDGTASLDTFSVETSLLADFSVSQVFGIFQMAIFGGDHPIAADVFSFSSNSLRYLRVNNLTNAGFGSATRVNEFAFRSAEGGSPPAIPTPTTLLLFSLGLAGLGWSKRKKAS